MILKPFVIAHGFNVKDGGADTIDTIKPWLPGDALILDADYGWIGLFGVKLYGKKIARVIAGMTPPGSIGIGHSNGCMELIRACEYGAKFNILILINPALDNDIKIPGNVDLVLVYHNVDDTTVTMAKWYPFSYWGDMGRVGYLGDNRKVLNFETKALFNVVEHSGIFNEPEKLMTHAKQQIKRFRDAITNRV